MFYVYFIIGSHGKLYVGWTSDLRERMKSHNSGESEYTKKFRPWKLIYYEAYLSGAEAKDREKKLKYRGRAKVFVKQRLMLSVKQAQNPKGARLSVPVE